MKEKVCVHTSRDIRAIASQLVNVWLEIFRKEKASNGVRSLRQATVDSWKRKSFKDPASGKPPLRSHHVDYEIRPSLQGSVIAGNQLNSNMKQNSKTINLEDKIVMSEEEQAAFAAEEAARAAAKAAAEVCLMCHVILLLLGLNLYDYSLFFFTQIFLLWLHL